MPRVAIIADDLTGALDTSVAFVAAGLTVAVAVTPAGLESANARATDVLVVNTASRALGPERAAGIVRAVAAHVPRGTIVLKKIDSRLKGNVAAETIALAESVGAVRLVVAPAVPAQGRPTRDGAVTGTGVATPLPITPLFAGSGLPLSVADAESDADLDRLVAAPDSSTLLVGASALGAALARRLGNEAHPFAFVPEVETLLAFASRDPITLAQIDELRRQRPGIERCELPAGQWAGQGPTCLPAIIEVTGPHRDDPMEVAARFGRAVAAEVERLGPTTLVVGGGDTALAVMAGLGVAVVAPIGEAAPGVVAFDIAMGPKRLRCLVKSGGFGSVDVLPGLVAAPLGTHRAARVVTQGGVRP